MRRREFIRSAALGALGVGTSTSGVNCILGPSRAEDHSMHAPLGSKTDRPNIILIMADDMGFSDVGCYGGEIDTPHIDRLGREGKRFTQFYNAARCCPTRASLLTGLYPHQAGVGHMRADLGIPAYRGHLNDRCVTIAEVLKEAGYHTAMSGKWHLGSAYDQWPNARGFDRFTGLLDGASDYFDPPPNKPLVRDNEPYAPKHVGYFESASNIDDDFYMTDFLSDWAVHYARELSQEDAPFFLYLPYTAPHWPIQAPEEDVRKYLGRFMEGWDVLRRRRYDRQLEEGLIDVRWALPERDSRVPAWDDADGKEEWDRRMAVYAAMIDRMDQGIGRLLDALAENGAADNTLILFLSDNGGSAEAVGRDQAAKPGGPDSYTSYLRPWAHLSDAPFRMYKHWVHEGGIATPLIAHWPAAITPGLDHTPGHVIDVLPTLFAAAAAPHPPEKPAADSALHAPEGRSLLPLLQVEAPGTDPSLNGGLPRRSPDPDPHPADDVDRIPLFWSHTDNHAVLHDGWKLVSAGGEWELYDMTADRTETNNLAADEPAKVRDLAAMHEAWADRVGVLPWEEYRAILQQTRNG